MDTLQDTYDRKCIRCQQPTPVGPICRQCQFGGGLRPRSKSFSGGEMQAVREEANRYAQQQQQHHQQQQQQQHTQAHRQPPYPPAHQQPPASFAGRHPYAFPGASRSPFGCAVSFVALFRCRAIALIELTAIALQCRRRPARPRALDAALRAARLLAAAARVGPALGVAAEWQRQQQQ